MQTSWDAMNGWRRFALRAGVVMLAAIAAGLPINDLFKYGLLLAIIVTAFAGVVSTGLRRWLYALALAATVIAGHLILPVPRIDEGFNIFVPPQSASDPTSLPGDVLRELTAQYNKQYPDGGCQNRDASCRPHTRSSAMNGFAFSADAIYDHPAFSRRVTGIRFSNTTWLRAGVINETVYNWPDDVTNIRRLERDRNSLNIFDRFRIIAPMVLAWRFPADFAGSDLCWQGTVFWEKSGGGYETLTHDKIECRQLRTEDVGHAIYAASILKDAQPAVTLHATWPVQLRRVLELGLTVIGVAGIGILLIKVQRRHLALPTTLIGIAALLTLVIDIHFIGGFRPLDGGDDGIAYEGFARSILRDLLSGNIVEVLRGGESIYFFTPGFRYFRMLERLIFGDTFLGYFSAMLLVPFLVLVLVRRFLSASWALGFVLLFTLTPVGVVYGSSFADYITTASRGYADSFAYGLMIAGLVTIIPPRDTQTPLVARAFLGALLLAMATFCRPNMVLVSVPFLFCASVIQLRQRHFAWVAALLLGYATLAVSPLHNYVFGHSLVPFSDNAITRETMRMLPSEYIQAALAVVTFKFSDPLILQGITQIGRWLGGTHYLLWTIPFNAAGFIILLYVAALGRRFDPWLRALAVATIFLHGIGICYVNYTRYNLATWLLTALISAVWWRQEGLALLMRWQPAVCERIAQSIAWQWAESRFARLRTALDLTDTSQSTSASVPR